MIPPFDEALDDLLEHYTHSDTDELIATMEKKIAALREWQKTIGRDG